MFIVLLHSLKSALCFATSNNAHSSRLVDSTQLQIWSGVCVCVDVLEVKHVGRACSVCIEM